MSLRNPMLRFVLFCGVVLAGLGVAARPAAGQSLPAISDYTGAATEPKRDDKRIAEELHRSVCWVNCSASANAAGWVLDEKRRLVLTSRRAIDQAKHILVYFPVKRLERWETDEGYYATTAKAYSAKVIASDYWYDLALLQLEGLPVDAKPLQLAPSSPSRGDRLHTLSAKVAGLSTLWAGNSGLVRGTGIGPVSNGWKPRILVASMFSTRHSRGEPLVNDRGQVAGVVEGATTAEVSGKPLSTGGTAIRALDVVQVKHWLKPVLRLIDPQTAADFYERGRRHVDERRYAEAVADLTTAIRRDSSHAKAWAQLGWARYYQKDYKTALVDFNKAVSLIAKDDDALYGRGIVQHRLKDDTAALRDFNAAIAINAGNWRYFNWRGIIHFQAKKHQDALDDFGRAAALDRTEFILFQNKGSAAMELKLYRTAAGAYEEANRLNSNDASNQNREGVCYYRLKDYAKAAKKFQDALKLNPKYWVYHENLGNAWQELGRHRDAIRAYSEGIREISYAPASLYYNRGLSYFAQKDYSEAIRDFTTALGKSPKFAAAYFQRARAYAAQGKTTLAAADLDKAKSLDKSRYGSATLANLGSATVAKPAGTTTTGTAFASKLAGRWYFRQKFNGRDTEIDLTFQGDGSYTSKITIFDENGRGTPAVESGTYTAKDGKLALTPKTGKAVTRSYGFEMKQLWIFFAESRVAVHFDRK